MVQIYSHSTMYLLKLEYWEKIVMYFQYSHSTMYLLKLI